MASLLTVAVLAAVHLWAGATATLRRQWRPRALSAAAGVSVCYVFLDPMPDLAERQVLIDCGGFLSRLEHHIYILAMVGHHDERYERSGQLLLAGGLLAGWLISMVPRIEIPPEALALVLVFIAGGTPLNILLNELPDTAIARPMSWHSLLARWSRPSCC